MFLILHLNANESYMFKRWKYSHLLFYIETVIGGFYAFSLGTYLVNVLGCFAIGLFYGLFERNALMNADIRLFLTVGF